MALSCACKVACDSALALDSSSRASFLAFFSSLMHVCMSMDSRSADLACASSTTARWVASSKLASAASARSESLWMLMRCVWTLSSTSFSSASSFSTRALASVACSRHQLAFACGWPAAGAQAQAEGPCKARTLAFTCSSACILSCRLVCTRASVLSS